MHRYSGEFYKYVMGHALIMPKFSMHGGGVIVLSKMLLHTMFKSPLKQDLKMRKLYFRVLRQPSQSPGLGGGSVQQAPAQ